jgi:cob(I)alamin adenosyltransferase
MLQIYTGDGKGKTTAALGLALRAIGAKKKVVIIQFMKKPDYSEHAAIKKYKLPIDVFSYGIGYYKILNDTHTEAEHRLAARSALKKSEDVISLKKYDLIILDEINVAVGFKLIKVDDVISVLKKNKDNTREIILTGRRADKKLLAMADLITEMKLEKHYFDNGTSARKGIEY